MNVTAIPSRARLAAPLLASLMVLGACGGEVGGAGPVAPVPTALPGASAAQPDPCSAEATRLGGAAAVAPLAHGAEVVASVGLEVGPGALAWTADDALLAIGDGPAIRIFAADSFEERWRFEDGAAHVTALAYSADGRWLASGDDRGGGRLWDLTRGRLARRFRAGASEVTLLAFARGGWRLLSSAGEARLWDLEHWVEQRSLAGNTLGASPGGDRWAVGADDGLFIADPESGARLRTIMPPYADLSSKAGANPHSAFYCGERELVAFYSSASAWLAFRRYDPLTGQPLGAGRAVGLMSRPLAATEGCSRVAIGGIDGTVRLLGVSSGKAELELKGHTDWPTVGAFSLGGHLLATAAPDGSTRIWDVDAGKELRRLEPQVAPTLALAVVGSPPRLVGAGPQGDLRSWELAASSLTSRTVPGGAASAWLSRDGKLAAWSSDEGGVIVWDAARKRVSRVPGERDRTPKGVDFSPDGKLVALTVDGQSTTLWDLAAARAVWSVPDTTVPNGMAFSPDGRRLVVSGVIPQVLDATTGAKLGSGPKLPMRTGSVSWLPSSDAIVLASGRNELGAVTVCRLSGPKPACTPIARWLRADRVAAVAASPDGQTIAVGLTSPHAVHGSAFLLETTTGKVRRTFALAHRWAATEIAAVTWAPDGRWIAWALRDGTLALFRADQPGAPVRLRALRGADAGYAESADGRFDLLGSASEVARAALRCRQAGSIKPLAECGPDALRPGLLPAFVTAERPCAAP